MPDSDEEDGFESQELKRLSVIEWAEGCVTSGGDNGSSSKETNAENPDETLNGAKYEDSEDRPVSPELPPLPSTPPARHSNDIFEFPSSSPDELQFVEFPIHKPNAAPSNDKQIDSQAHVPSDSGGSSPLSSPPSFLDISPPEQSTPAKEAPRPVEDGLEELSNRVEVEGELPEELDQPARRSLRERNPIQLHPYLLEDAQYQRLMKARGIRPVHAVRYHDDGDRNQAHESQSYESSNTTNILQNSSEADIFLPKSPALNRSVAQRKPPRHNAQGVPLPATLSNGDGGRKVKRPKLIHQDDGDDQRSRNQRPFRLSGTTNQEALPGQVEADSLWDIPDSPGEPGNSSSSQATHFSGFRFPRGFTPPIMTTPITEPTPKANADHAVRVDLSEPEDDQNPVDVDLTMARTESSHEVVDEPDQAEAVVKKLRRKIKGVLPASWLRLDLKQQEARSGPQQPNRGVEVPHKPDNAKGVARKVARSNSGTFSTPRRQSAHAARLFDFDNDTVAQEEDDDTAINDPLEEFIGPTGIDDILNSGELSDGDIPEDNRVDDMFPPAPFPAAPRRAVASGQKHGVKRPRPPGDGAKAQGPRKHSHPKRQSQEPIHRRRGPKPRRNLGILDAPDVVRRPRKEQPQFIRVAARQARTRRNRGRGSPTNKIFVFSSGLDTEDTNVHLREWQRGEIPQTQPMESVPSPRPCQPLIDLTSEQDNSDHRGPGRNGLQDLMKASSAQKRPTEGNSPGVSASTRIAPSGASNRKSSNSGRGNRWIINRNIGISSLHRNFPRPAELQLDDIGRTNLETPSLFQRSLSYLNRNFALRKGSQRHENNLLDRFLSENVPPLHSPNRQEISINSGVPKASEQTRLRQQRKRTPVRLDLTAYAIENEPPPETYAQELEGPSSVQTESRDLSRGAFDGTRSFKLSYTPDFEIVPLSTGTYFHEHTLIGSGEFARSLEVPSRDLDKDAGLASVHIGGKHLQWGSWDDTVSSEMGMAFEVIAKVAEKHVAGAPDAESPDAEPVIRVDQSYAIYRSMIGYVNHNLHFCDPVDRAGLVERLLCLVYELSERLTAFTPNPGHGMGCLVRIACYNLVFVNQASQIARHDLVESRIENEALELVKTISRQLVALIVSGAGLRDIGLFLENNKRLEFREAGIRDDNFTVEAFVIARHVLHSTDKTKTCFESNITDSLLQDAGYSNSSADVPSLESKWHAVFATLPLNEIDRSGMARIGGRFREANDNWPMVKRILQPVLDGYNTDPSGYPASFNNYCRALFCRCFHLINGWGWRDCKPILDTLFDFFARNALYNLNHEEVFGSPSFLDKFDPDMSLQPRPGDPCFHIFLKIVGSGLRFLSEKYDKKKIRNFAWRLLPNHGRVYPKEKPLRQEDLDALRNHHDLLCTLFLVVPEGCRPRLETIRNLVHPATSHRETCNISLQSWSRLVRFKLSTDEDVAGLDPFSDWHGYFMTELLKQHSQARIEIEAQNGAGSGFSRRLVESTISQNERQIELLLSTALKGMKRAIQIAPTLEHARRLVSKMPIKAILGLFSPKLARINGIVCDGLQIISAYVEKDSSLPAAIPRNPPPVDEDSQEYGDWSDIEALYGQEEPASPPSPGVDHVEKVFHPAVSRLLSNCFGEDQYPDDAILLAVVDCWTSLAQMLVRHGLRHWDSYVDHYDANSWLMLRTTAQTRKFTPRFLASCIDKDPKFLSECSTQVLGMWMSALVERTSMLKFQHLLTAALLNQDPENPLLRNLPFLRDQEEEEEDGGGVIITLEDFSQRRLSLISSILSNMREHLKEIQDEERGGQRPWEVSIKGQEYRELIERLMASMKANYQELGDGSAESARGAYVHFVQCIVSFLQEYTQDICPIDPFFIEMQQRLAARP